ncbi:MAG: glycosyltransferase [Infirmifilum sp.]
MRVLFVSEYLRAGGAEKFLLSLVRGLTKVLGDSIEIHVATADRLNMRLGTLRRLNIKVHYIPSTRLYFQLRILGMSHPLIARKFDTLLSKVKPDLVHLNNIAGFGLTPLKVLYERNIPTVFTLHDHWVICPNTLLYNGSSICDNNLACLRSYCVKFTMSLPQLNSILDKRFQFVQSQLIPELLKEFNLVAVSKYLAQIMKKFLGLEPTVIYNGLELEGIFELNETEWLSRSGICYLGGARVEKGYYIVRNLIKRMQSLVKSGEVMFFVRGLQKDFENIGVLPGQVLVKRYFNNVSEVYKKSFVTLIPSIWPEPFPYTALEALAYGSLVLAFRIGGIPEEVEDERLLVDPYNIDDYYQRLLDIIRDRARYFELALKLSKSVRSKFSLENTTKKYIELYERVVK